ESAAIATHDAAALMEATETLGFIKDPIAVPPLVRLIESNRIVESWAIPGLGRIADESAVEALISLLGSPSSRDTGDLARVALAKLASRTGDRQLKQRISKV